MYMYLCLFSLFVIVLSAYAGFLPPYTLPVSGKAIFLLLYPVGVLTGVGGFLPPKPLFLSLLHKCVDCGSRVPPKATGNGSAFGRPGAANQIFRLYRLFPGKLNRVILSVFCLSLPHPPKAMREGGLN